MLCMYFSERETPAVSSGLRTGSGVCTILYIAYGCTVCMYVRNTLCTDYSNIVSARSGFSAETGLFGASYSRQWEDGRFSEKGEVNWKTIFFFCLRKICVHRLYSCLDDMTLQYEVHTSYMRREIRHPSICEHFSRHFLFNERFMCTTGWFQDFYMSEFWLSIPTVR